MALSENILKPNEFQKGHTPWNKGLFDNPKAWMKRFNSKYIIQKNGCWEWQGPVHSLTGYANFWQSGTNILAHRFSYQMFHGMIPEKLTIDHLCKNRKCVNPYHLDLVTRVENVLRSNNEIAHNKEKIICSRGHPYDAVNTYLRKNGQRACRKCHQIRKQQYRLKRRSDLGWN